MTKGSILVVDDDMAFVDALQIYLGDQGFRITRAASGRRGIASANLQPIDLAIVDLHLPDMDGSEVVTTIRRMQPSTQFVIISSDDSPETLSKCSSARPCLFMTKPLAPDEFSERIHHLVGTKKHPTSFSLVMR